MIWTLPIGSTVLLWLMLLLLKSKQQHDPFGFYDVVMAVAGTVITLVIWLVFFIGMWLAK